MAFTVNLKSRSCTRTNLTCCVMNIFLRIFFFRDSDTAISITLN